MLLWENFSKEKKTIFSYFISECSWVQGPLAFPCGVCRFSPICHGSLQVLQFPPSVQRHVFEGKGWIGQPKLSLGWMCVWIVAFPHWSCDELIQGGMGSSRTCPRPHHHSHNPTREKQLDGWTHTHIYQYVCFCVLCRADYFVDYGCQRNKRKNKFYSISASCVTMALWFRKLSR